MHVCIYAYIFKYTYIHIYIYTYIHIYKYTYIHMYIYIYVYLQITIHMSRFESLSGCMWVIYVQWFLNCEWSLRNSSRRSSKVLRNMASSYPNRYGPAASSSALQPVLPWTRTTPMEAASAFMSTSGFTCTYVYIYISKNIYIYIYIYVYVYIYIYIYIYIDA